MIDALNRALNVALERAFYPLLIVTMIMSVVAYF